MDLYSRAIIGWALNNRIETFLISEALQKALWKRKFPKGILVHSDRGSQYCSDDYQKLLKNNSLVCSMSRKGNCWDNAPIESFYHTLKVELVQFFWDLTQEKKLGRLSRCILKSITILRDVILLLRTRCLLCLNPLVSAHKKVSI
jgi:putative transposase